MEKRYFTITIRRQETLEEQCRREAAERRAARFWYAAAVALILILLALCWRAVETRDTRETERAEETTPGPVVQTLQLDLGVSEPAEAVSTLAESGAEDTGQDQGHLISDCTITHFCAEAYPHICGTGDGLTATGTQVQPGVTCAVDPDVIPLGSTVMVDFGDGVLHAYRAEDTGGAVRGNHVDLCVASHQEAEALGVMYATVCWKEDKK